jgi:hypothetical protein
MNKTVATALALAAFTTTALANGNADPRLPKEVQGIHSIVGEWTAKSATATMDGKKVKLTASFSCAATASGFGVLCKSKFDIAGMGTLEETDLFGWDPGEGKYHWFAVNATGETHDHVAAPPASPSDALVFVYSGRTAGKPMQEIISLKFNADSSVVDVRNQTLVDGKLAFQMALTMIKK